MIFSAKTKKSNLNKSLTSHIKINWYFLLNFKNVQSMLGSLAQSRVVYILQRYCFMTFIKYDWDIYQRNILSTGEYFFVTPNYFYEYTLIPLNFEWDSFECQPDAVNFGCGRRWKREAKVEWVFYE